MDTSFWLYKPSILIKKEDITKIIPDNNMSSNEKLNAITRLIILISILAFFITEKQTVFITGVVTILSIVVLHTIQRNEEVKKGIIDVKETFSNMDDVYGKLPNTFTHPTENNPIMNVLMTEYSDNPTNRKPAAPSYFPNVINNINESTKQLIKNNFNDDSVGDKLFNDLGDSYGFNQSMRAWYATPNTKIPNDQDEFAKFCYGTITSCKEGDDFACLQSDTRWMNKH